MKFGIGILKLKQYGKGSQVLYVFFKNYSTLLYLLYIHCTVHSIFHQGLQLPWWNTYSCLKERSKLFSIHTDSVKVCLTWFSPFLVKYQGGTVQYTVYCSLEDYRSPMHLTFISSGNCFTGIVSTVSSRTIFCGKKRFYSFIQCHKIFVHLSTFRYFWLLPK